MPLANYTTFINTDMKVEIDRNEAQKLYDSGLSIRDLAKHYGVSKYPIQCLKLKARSITDATNLGYQNGKGIISNAGRARLSRSAKENGLGGYRPHPNRGVRYKGIWFDSKYELTVAQNLDLHRIRWTRPKQGFVWNDAGNKYYPDFHLSDFDVYLDPKNDYLIEKDRFKIEQASKRNNIRVLVLNKSQLTWDAIKMLL